MDKIEKLREMLQTEPGDPFLLHALALEQIKAGNDPEACRIFTEVLTANPDYVGSYYHLGRLHERNGRAAEALKWYAKGMKTAREQGDRHAHGELQAAFEDISDS